MPDISKINALAIGSVGKVDGLAKASILDIDGVTVPSAVGAPEAAYSVRLLGSEVGISSYTGDCMRVRRASDNVEADVGFDAGELKLTSPISNTSDAQSYTDFADFVDHTGTPTNAFVRYWYDQSGNANDAGQSTAGNQPKIYDASTGLITVNGKPAHLGGYFENISTITKSSNWSSFETYTSISGDTSFITYAGDTLPNAHSVMAFQNYTAGPTIRNFGSPSYFKDGSSISLSTPAAAYTALATNSQLLLSVINADNSVWDAFYLRSYNNGSFAFDGYMQEQIFYGSDETNNRTGIETDINGFFSIYP